MIMGKISSVFTLLQRIILEEKIYWAVILILCFLVIYRIFIPAIFKLNTYEIISNPLIMIKLEGNNSQMKEELTIGTSNFKFKSTDPLLYTRSNIKVNVDFTFTDKEYFKKKIEGKSVWVVFGGASDENRMSLLELKKNPDNPYLFKGGKTIKYNIEGFNGITLGASDIPGRSTFDPKGFPIHFHQRIPKAIFIAGARDKLAYLLTMVIIALTLLTTYLNIIKR